MAPPLNSPTSPTSPKSPTTSKFGDLNLKALAQSTKKSFDRLAPYTKLQDTQRPEENAAVVDPLVNRFRDRMVILVNAIDSSISAVEIIYHLSKEAGTLCDITALPPASDEPAATTTDEKGKAPAQTTSNTLAPPEQQIPKPMSRAASLHSLLQIGRSNNNSDNSEEDKLVKSRKKIDELASNACTKASEAAQAFRQVDQELYKLAAAGKDIPVEATVKIPVDAAGQSKLLTKTIRDLGTDLVNNLKQLTTFSNHLTDLNEWCEWVQKGVASSDFEGGSALLPSEVDTISRRNNLNAQWTKVLSDTVLYHNMMSDMLDRYAEILSRSSESWGKVAEERENEKSDKPKGMKALISGVLSVVEALKGILSCSR